MHIIGGKFKRKLLFTPKSPHIRPTTSQTREALFNICQHEIEGAHFLDLFAGTGAMGLEALSRGAASATFVDKNRAAYDVIKKNIALLKVEEQTTIYTLEAFKALQKMEDEKQTFDIVYIDPPYGEELSAPVLSFFDTHSLLSKKGRLFLEDVALHVPPLNNLQIESTRKIGRAYLYEYRFTSR